MEWNETKTTWSIYTGFELTGEMIQHAKVP